MEQQEICAVTGSTGYVGSIIASALSTHMKVVPLTRRDVGPHCIEWEFDSGRDITEQLRSRGITTLVHAAWDMRSNTLDELRHSSVAGSGRLFEMASRAGVSRIVFISTISAFEGCRAAYGRSKLEAEHMAAAKGGIILRPGLVFGPTSGGVFGAIRAQVRKTKFIPLVGNGRAPQYLLHEDTLKDIIVRCATGQFDSLKGVPLTIAHSNPWLFRELVSQIARAENRNVTLVPVPWQILYAGLKTAETIGMKLPVRSDSVISFIYQNPKPDFSTLFEYGVQPLPFTNH